jgi:hypothetical protein
MPSHKFHRRKGGWEVRTLASLSQRYGARMARILEALQAHKEGVGADVLSAIGKVTKYRVAGFVKVLRGEGFTVEYTTRWKRDSYTGLMRKHGYYRLDW